MKNLSALFTLILLAATGTAAQAVKVCDQDLFAVEREAQYVDPSRGGEMVVNFYPYEFNQISESVNPRYFGYRVSSNRPQNLSLRASALRGNHLAGTYQLTRLPQIETQEFNGSPISFYVFDTGTYMADRLAEFNATKGTVLFVVFEDQNPLCELRVPLYRDTH